MEGPGIKNKKEQIDDVGKRRKVWKITESPHVINLINRVEKKRRINKYIYIYIKEKREIQKPPNQKPSGQ